MNPIIPCVSEISEARLSFFAPITFTQSVGSVVETPHPFSVGKIPWDLSVQGSNIDQGLQILLACEELHNANIWRVSANINITLLSQRDESPLVKAVTDREFNLLNRTHFVMVTKEEVDRLMPDGWSEQPDAQYQLEGTMELVIRHKDGLRHRSQFSYDFFVQNELSNLVLLMDEKKVYVNVQYLAHYSSFFYQFTFKEKWAELEKDKASGLHFLNLPSVNCHSFIELLKLLYPTEGKVTGDNVEGLMKVADYMFFETILIKCEEFLTSEDPAAQEIDICKKLQWSFNYRMSHLQEKCLSFLTDSKKIAALKNEAAYNSMKEEVKSILFDRMTQLVLGGQ